MQHVFTHPHLIVKSIHSSVLLMGSAVSVGFADWRVLP